MAPGLVGEYAAQNSAKVRRLQGNSMVLASSQGCKSQKLSYFDQAVLTWTGRRIACHRK